MPLPIALGLLTIAATAGPGVVKGAFAASKNAEAEDLLSDTELLIKNADERLGYARQFTLQNMKRLGEVKIKIASREIKKFVDIFRKIKNVNLSDGQYQDEWKKIAFTDNELQEMQLLSSEAYDLVNGGLSGIGTGILTGIGAYHGVTALASASTGTAISTLKGAASAKATLAWFGGGAIASGGLGVAGGVVILGGLVAGPMLLVAGGIMESKANKNLDCARTNFTQAKEYCAKVNTAVSAMEVICDAAAFVNNKLVQMDRKMITYIKKMDGIIQMTDDWEQMNSKQKKEIAACVEFVQMTKKFMDMPLLGENGLISRQARDLCAGNSQKITKTDLLEWKSKNVDNETEIMIIADPALSQQIAAQIELDSETGKKYFVLAVLDKDTQKILRYGLIERSKIDLAEAMI